MASKGFLFVCIFVAVLHACAAKPWSSQSKRHFILHELRMKRTCDKFLRGCASVEDCESPTCSMKLACQLDVARGEKVCSPSAKDLTGFFRREYLGQPW
ncbi:Hypothetical predicted protein [Paramuricea clavata]|uniref:Uncharacterized protein n=1 Tax=Paramuricea clavata TaxID=317549 RepID=A0A7D9I0B1_PARCT|nr:Hypothetical predicted protein [Paramuricea clavata]